MEKYGQYRDKGSGIAPFFPIAPPDSSPLLAPYHLFLFSLRIPFLIFAWAVWIFLVQWVPAGGALRKGNLWCILGIPGVWWVDVRVDGVQRGSLGKAIQKLPGPGSIIAASYSSPLDILYLAAIFDPIFTQSFPNSRKVKQLSLESAVASCFCFPGPESDLVDLADLSRTNPSRIIIVFPETTTSNGRGVLRLSPSLLSAGRDTRVTPISLKYTPSDVVTPIPGWIEAPRFLWKLCSRQTHCIRVRVGHALTMTEAQKAQSSELASREARGRQQKNVYDTNFFDSLQSKENEKMSDVAQPTEAEQRALDLIAEELSRLGRVKTLGLGLEEKIQFVNAWKGNTNSKKRK
ncbi:hypothetical protein AC578_2063 [Pseudocercospora eumusae]|uniref:Phospholipid/glycerol acyltransferase domain-containing protein n=1 Tax=Pseudocercospora eumusae TaxID=321146 RepID=A0A139H8Q2_9PEZI|nr:hypothetical protein AC578_2063 [Pseudocercospora eumusae]